MSDIPGLKPTGRQFKSPTFTLEELENEEGLRHTAIVFEPDFHQSKSLTMQVDLVESFMTYPMVIGLVEMSARYRDLGAFIYPTGTFWSAREVIRTYGDIRSKVGVRAAVEMCVVAAQILNEAGENGPVQGCFSHGSLSPWTLGFKRDGQVQIIGYGLPHADLAAWRDDGRPIDVESLRYAPPERLEQLDEEASSDLYSLTVTAIEMAIGRPLFSGRTPDEVVEQIRLAKGAQLLGQLTDLPKPVRDAWARALIFDPEARLHGEEYEDAMSTLLDLDLPGPSLEDAMKKLATSAPRPVARKLVSKADTTAFSPAQLAAMADEEDDDESEAAASTGADNRWGNVTRSRTSARSEEEADRGSTGRRLRRRGEASTAAATPATPAAANPVTPRASAVDGDSRRRLRRGETAEEAPAAPPADEPDAGGRTRRRLRRGEADNTPDEATSEAADSVSADSASADSASADSASADSASPADEPTATPAAEPTGRTRRRLRRGDAGDSADDSATTDEPSDDDDDSGSSGEAAAAADNGDRPRRRLRRGDDAPEPEAPAAEPEAPSPDDEGGRPRRRLRRGE